MNNYDFLRKRRGEDRAFAQVVSDASQYLDFIGMYGEPEFEKFVERNGSIDIFASQAKMKRSMMKGNSGPKLGDVLAELRRYEHIGGRYAVAGTLRRDLINSRMIMRKYSGEGA